MSRALLPAVTAAIADSNVPGVVFAQFEFSGGTKRFCNAGYTMSWNSYLWKGVGEVGKIEPISEGGDLQAYNLSMQLSGIDPDTIAVALVPAYYKRRAASVWFAALNSEYGVLISPVLIFKGRIDTMQIELGATATITATAESPLADWQRPRSRFWNGADQQSRYPTDKFFEYVEQTVKREIIWGRQ